MAAKELKELRDQLEKLDLSDPEDMQEHLLATVIQVQELEERVAALEKGTVKIQ
jgi:hypothetical protein